MIIAANPSSDTGISDVGLRDGRNGQIVRQKNRILHLLLQPGDGHLAQVVGLHHKT